MRSDVVRLSLSKGAPAQIGSSTCDLHRSPYLLHRERRATQSISDWYVNV